MVELTLAYVKSIIGSDKIVYDGGDYATKGSRIGIWGPSHFGSLQTPWQNDDHGAFLIENQPEYYISFTSYRNQQALDKTLEVARGILSDVAIEITGRVFGR